MRTLEGMLTLTVQDLINGSIYAELRESLSKDPRVQRTNAKREPIPRPEFLKFKSIFIHLFQKPNEMYQEALGGELGGCDLPLTSKSKVL